jgi:CRISPR/Cas system-associated endonuclease/helicase Cas3
VFTNDEEVVDMGNEHVSFVFNLLKSLGPSNVNKWKPYRTFYMSAEGELQFDFSEESKTFSPFGSGGVKMIKDLPGVYTSIKNFDIKINELNVFKGETKINDEADYLNMQITAIKSWNDNVPFLFKPL